MTGPISTKPGDRAREWPLTKSAEKLQLEFSFVQARPGFERHQDGSALSDTRNCHTPRPIAPRRALAHQAGR